MKSRIVAAVVGQCFLDSRQTGSILKSRIMEGRKCFHTRLTGSCCSGPGFCRLHTRLTGGIVNSRMVAAVVGYFSLKY